MTDEQLLRELMAQVPRPQTLVEQAAARAASRLPARASDARPARTKCSFDLSSDLVTRFRALCALQSVHQRRVIEQLVQAYVRQHGGLLAA